MVMSSNAETTADKFVDQSIPFAESRIPILIWMVLIYVAALVMQSSVDYSRWIESIFFTGIMVLQGSLYWYSPTLAMKHPFLYFVIQGLLIYVASYLIPNGSPITLIGLYPMLISQSLGVFDQKRKIAAVALGSYGLMCIAFVITGWSSTFLLLISIFILMNIVVVSYAMLFLRQVRARLRTQNFLHELERTHRKVEELTLSNERQRMARDLHDTLAQGLAGLLMQLEAADEYLDQSNPERAQDIIKKAMLRGRSTLSDARLVIDDLRLNGDGDSDFAHLVRTTINKIESETSISITYDIPSTLSLPAFLTEHCLHIITEGMTNVVRHADAKWIQVTVRLDHSAKNLFIRITDNGIGFNMDMIGKRTGHYGLIGIRERVRLLDASLNISSTIGEGTILEVTIPLKNGEDE
jgi:NarL family two-component system sensor histidine kinase YdfH